MVEAFEGHHYPITSISSWTTIVLRICIYYRPSNASKKEINTGEIMQEPQSNAIDHTPSVTLQSSRKVLKHNSEEMALQRGMQVTCPNSAT